MPTQVIDDNIWKDEIAAANRYYKDWENTFHCKDLERYYEGFQWKGLSNEEYRPYTINKIYETIQIKIDTFVSQFPRFTVSPRPGSSDFDLETAAVSSQLKQDVLNQIIANEKEYYPEETRMCYKDSFSRFGMMEVGYSADWVQNPLAQRPLLNTNKSKDNNNKKPAVVSQPTELPQNERVFVKHISAAHFRVGGIDHRYLHKCNWCGYFEYFEKDDILAMRGLMNQDKLVQSGGQGSQMTAVVGDQDERKHNRGTSWKVWKLWHNKAKVQVIFIEDVGVTIFQRKFTRLPLYDFRPDPSLITEGFYPVPPMWHWISPQNEINETREQLRAHRRRFIRKYQYLEGTVDETEITKFETGGDGTLVKVKKLDAITAIQDAPLGQSLDKAIITSADDLNQISGTSAETRGVADRTTATQANIISQAANTRSNSERDRITGWMTRIAREILLTIREKFTLGIWVEYTADNKESLFGEVQQNKPAYTWVSQEDLNDGYDFRIDVDVTSLSVTTQQQEKQNFIEFITLTTQFPQIALSPKLIRETAYRVGYRNEGVIREMQNMALLHQMSTMSGIAQATQGQQAAQQVNAQNMPPTTEQVRNQLQNQIGVTQ